MNTMTKTRTILLILTFIPIFLFGQKTKKVNNNDTYEEYYVLKSDKSVKHGSYKKFDYNGTTLINGCYKNAVKDSIWEFYDNKSELQQKYDFSKNELVYNKISGFAMKMKFEVMDNSDSTKTIPDRPPIYIGTEAVLVQIIQQNIKYPRAAMENGTSGIVYILFTIDKSGKTSNHRLFKGIGSGCDEEALRVVKSMPDNWLPGLLNGQAVDVEATIPISYTLVSN